MNTTLIIIALDMIRAQASEAPGAWQVRSGEPPQIVDLNGGEAPSWEVIESFLPAAQEHLDARTDPTDIPPPITRLQRNLWLGKARYAALTTWANSLPEEEKYEASIYLRDAETTERHHPMTLVMAQVLGMSSEDIDQAFREASLL